MEQQDQADALTTEGVMAALRKVYDPEIPVNVVDLGLIYDVSVDAAAGRVGVKMTLTAPGCGLAPVIAGNAEQAVRSVPGVKEVGVQLVWEPRWTPERMSDQAKKTLGFA